MEERRFLYHAFISYPPALRQGGEAPLEAALTELTPDQALVKVAAAILGLKFDQLYQRHQRHQRLRRPQLAAAATMLVLAAAVGGFLWWNYVRTTVRYYADYVECWGVPRGLRALTKAQCRQREFIAYEPDLRGVTLRAEGCMQHAFAGLEDLGLAMPDADAPAKSDILAHELAYGDDGEGRVGRRMFLNSSACGCATPQACLGMPAPTARTRGSAPSAI